MSRSALVVVICLAYTLRATGAVSDSLDGEDYPSFINRSTNRLIGDQKLLVAVFERMDSIRNGDTLDGAYIVPILHFGDSHIQAGFIASAARHDLQSQWGNAGEGLVAPLHLAGTNQPSGSTIRSDAAWHGCFCTSTSPAQEPGVTGMALHTTDNDFAFEITSSVPFSQITVFEDPHAPLLTAPDSLTTGICCPEEDEHTSFISLLRPVGHLTLRGNRTVDTLYNQACYYGFSLENGRSGILYHSVGINGNTLAATLRNPQIFDQASALDPQLVIVSLGTNDAMGSTLNPSQTEEQLTRLVGQIRKSIPHAAIVLTTPMENYRRVRIRRRTYQRPNTNMAAIRDCIARTAKAEGCLLWDFYTVAGGAGAMDAWSQAGMAAADRIHLSREGYTCEGHLLAEALIDAYHTYRPSTIPFAKSGLKTHTPPDNQIK